MKQKKPVLALMTALMLTAQTLPALAESSGASQIADAGLGCQSLLQEISTMDGAIAQANDEKHEAAAARVGSGIAQSAGLHFLGGLGGVLGILGVSAAVGVATNAKQVNAEIAVRDAQTRRATLLGIYAGKGCSLAAIEPAAGPDDSAVEPAGEPMGPPQSMPKRIASGLND